MDVLERNVYIAFASHSGFGIIYANECEQHENTPHYAAQHILCKFPREYMQRITSCKNIYNISIIRLLDGPGFRAQSFIAFRKTLLISPWLCIRLPAARVVQLGKRAFVCLLCYEL